MSQTWQIRGQDKIYGPFTIERLRQLAENGKLLRETPIRRDGGVWVAAESVSGIFESADSRTGPAAFGTFTKPLPPPATQAPFSFADDESSDEADDDEEDADTGRGALSHSEPNESMGVNSFSGNRAPSPRHRRDDGAFRPNRLLSREPQSLADFLDVTFNRYLTVWLIRAAWGLVLAFGGLTLLLIAFGTFMDLFKIPFPGAGGPGKAGGPGLNFAIWLAANPVLAPLFRGGILVLMVILCLVALRILFECVIVLFNIASSLKRLELNTEHSPSSSSDASKE